MSVRFLGLLVLSLICLSSGFAGELDPPAPPASTPGPEARTPIFDADLPLTIDERGGSFYFAEPLTYEDTDSTAITVTERFVTIDLNGFTLEGPGRLLGTTNNTGIWSTGVARDVIIRNGTVSGFGADGVRITARGGHVADVHVFDVGEAGINITADNGQVTDCTVQSCDVAGIQVGPGSLVRDCVARGNATGIDAEEDCSIIACVAVNNTGVGINTNGTSTLKSCAAHSNGEEGILIIGNGSVENCVANDNGDDGIQSTLNTVFVNCSAFGNADSGMVTSSGLIIDCTADGNDGSGFWITSSGSVERCKAQGNGTADQPTAGVRVSGVHARADGNSLVRNIPQQILLDGDNIAAVRNIMFTVLEGGLSDTGSGNDVAPVRTNYTGAGPWDNFEF
jgi:hypothetical protein